MIDERKKFATFRVVMYINTCGTLLHVLFINLDRGLNMAAKKKSSKKASAKKSKKKAAKKKK